MLNGSRLLQAVGVASGPEAAHGSVAEAPPSYGLVWTRTNLIVVALVVLAVFLERFERIEGDGSYPILPIPDFFFLAAVGLFAVKVAFDHHVGRLTLRRLGWKDVVLGGFVALLGALSLVSVLTQPSDVTSGVQSLKTFIHLVALLGVALLLGHALSRELVAYAMHVYFVGAVVVAGLGIVQALDQNVVTLRIADSLDLISRVGAGGFVRPCSIFSEPAYLGYVSLGGIVIGLSLVSERHKVAALLGCVVCAAALLLASAAGPLAVTVPLGVYVLAVRLRLFPRGVVLPASGVAIVAAALLLLTPVGDTIMYRAEDVSSGQDASVELRTELNKASVDIWKTAPVTGVGLGNSRRHFGGQIDVSWAPQGSSVAFNSASAYVNLLGEAGPLAVVALGLVLLALWWRSEAAPPRLDELTRVFIVLLALEFFIINPLIMPPVWFWAGQRLALQD